MGCCGSKVGSNSNISQECEEEEEENSKPSGKNPLIAQLLELKAREEAEALKNAIENKGAEETKAEVPIIATLTPEPITQNAPPTLAPPADSLSLPIPNIVRKKSMAAFAKSPNFEKFVQEKKAGEKENKGNDIAEGGEKKDEKDSETKLNPKIVKVVKKKRWGKLASIIKLFGSHRREEEMKLAAKKKLEEEEAEKLAAAAMPGKSEKFKKLAKFSRMIGRLAPKRMRKPMTFKSLAKFSKLMNIFKPFRNPLEKRKYLLGKWKKANRVVGLWKTEATYKKKRRGFIKRWLMPRRILGIWIKGDPDEEDEEAEKEKEKEKIGRWRRVRAKMLLSLKLVPSDKLEGAKKKRRKRRWKKVGTTLGWTGWKVPLFKKPTINKLRWKRVNNVVSVWKFTVGSLQHRRKRKIQSKWKKLNKTLNYFKPMSIFQKERSNFIRKIWKKPKTIVGVVNIIKPERDKLGVAIKVANAVVNFKEPLANFTPGANIQAEDQKSLGSGSGALAFDNMNVATDVVRVVGKMKNKTDENGIEVPGTPGAQSVKSQDGSMNPGSRKMSKTSVPGTPGNLIIPGTPGLSVPGSPGQLGTPVGSGKSTPRTGPGTPNRSSIPGTPNSIKSVKKLTEDEKKKVFALRREIDHLDKLIKEAEGMKRASREQLNKIRPKFRDAWRKTELPWCAIDLMRSVRHNPPKTVQLVMEAICILKGMEPDVKFKGTRGEIPDVNYLNASRKLLAGNLSEELWMLRQPGNFNLVNLIEFQERILSDPNFDREKIMQAFPPCAIFYDWLMHVDEFAKISCQRQKIKRNLYYSKCLSKQGTIAKREILKKIEAIEN